MISIDKYTTIARYIKNIIQPGMNSGTSCDEIAEYILNKFATELYGSWKILDIRCKIKNSTIKVQGHEYEYHWVLCIEVEKHGWIVVDPMHNVAKIASRYCTRIRRENRHVGIVAINQNSIYTVMDKGTIWFNTGDLLTFKPKTTRERKGDIS